MKHNIKYFLAGMLVMIILSSTVTPALADSITKTIDVVLNSANIKLNGIDVCKAGEDYTLPNGSTVPNSITYTDENGGGTTYLPLRKISELLSLTVDYDSDTRTAILTSNPDNTAAPQNDTTTTDNVKSWSAEDEAAYQDFRSLWSATSSTPYNTQLVEFAYIGSISEDNFVKYWNDLDDSIQKSYVFRLMMEHIDIKAPNGTCYVEMNSTFLWNAYWMRGSIYSISTGLTTKTY